MVARKIKRSEQLPPSSPFLLLVRLASGGMGAVYLGLRKGTTGPLLAIKRPHAHLTEEPSFRKMFVAEARLASLIRDPNVVGVRDVLEADGELLMVMDYVEGVTLAELVTAANDQGHRVPISVVVRVLVDAARGLHAAHEMCGADGRPLNIVHRDVSPQNIMIGGDGRAAIVDFGVAKALSEESTKTASEVLKGKMAYMAPEYVTDRKATRASDVFGLGVVAWEAIANRRLWKGEDDLETMRRLTDATPAPMLSDLTAIDVNVAAIVARAVVKAPEKRFLSAKDFADALEANARRADLYASPSEVAASLTLLLGPALRERQRLVQGALHEWLPGATKGADSDLANEPSHATLTAVDVQRFDVQPFDASTFDGRPTLGDPTIDRGPPRALAPRGFTVPFPAQQPLGAVGNAQESQPVSASHTHAGVAQSTARPGQRRSWGLVALLGAGALTLSALTLWTFASARGEASPDASSAHSSEAGASLSRESQESANPGTELRAAASATSATSSNPASVASSATSSTPSNVASSAPAVAATGPAPWASAPPKPDKSAQPTTKSTSWLPSPNPY